MTNPAFRIDFCELSDVPDVALRDAFVKLRDMEDDMRLSTKIWKNEEPKSPSRQKRIQALQRALHYNIDLLSVIAKKIKYAPNLENIFKEMRISAKACNYIDIIRAIDKIEDRISVHRAEEYFSMKKNEEPLFSLNEREISTISKMTAEVRKLVQDSDIFDDKWKTRLLDRLSSFELEMHKPRARVDVFFAGLKDFGDALGAFGGGAKPLVDEVERIVKLVRGKSETYKGLPSPEEQKKIEGPRKELPAPEHSEEPDSK